MSGPKIAEFEIRRHRASVEAVIPGWSPLTLRQVRNWIAHNEETLRLPDTYYDNEDGTVGGGLSHQRAAEALEFWRKVEAALLEGEQQP